MSDCSGDGNTLNSPSVFLIFGIWYEGRLHAADTLEIGLGLPLVTPGVVPLLYEFDCTISDSDKCDTLAVVDCTVTSRAADGLEIVV